MTPETELLLKHATPVSGASALIAFPPAPADAIAITRRLSADETVIYTPDSGIHAAVSRAAEDLRTRSRIRTVFGAWYAAEGNGHAGATLHLPREREMVEFALSMVRRALAPGATVWLAGGLRGGARSAAALIERHLGRPERLAAARHCLLYRATVDAPRSPSATPDGWARTFPVAISGRTVTIVTLPGVFSHGRLDPGTRLLLGTLDAGTPAPSRVLDFGCGAGVIGACLKTIWPGVPIDMVDVNAFAVEASRRTLAANGLDPGAVRASDSFSEVGDRYDLIVSNPPFHSGTATDYSVTETLVRQAADHLLPRGRLCLVANRFLRYPGLLRAVFGNATTLAEDGRYRVIEATRHGRRRP